MPDVLGKSVPRREIIFSKPLNVHAACHVQIGFDVDSPQDAELIIEHLRAGQLLARERRSLAVGARALDIKTHPEASHITCSLRAGDLPIDGVRFDVDCGRGIEPTGRHFIVVGAMKAGTTTLFELLAKHPALCQTWANVPKESFPKEINYFRKLYRKGDTPLHYDWRFPFDPARHAWTLDASPGYAKWPGSKGVPARIASLGAEIKLAFILREPVDRIESHLAHTLHRGGETKNMKHCIRTSRYAMQLDKFMVHFARDDILLLDFEQLKRDPAAIQGQIFDFLGIDHIVAPCEIHNTRGFDFHLDAAQRTELAKAVRSDVRRLINLYNFKPAERWLQDIV
jgi:hypothetical protein